MKKLKVEMIHDVVCSWCPIGYANLKQALKNLELDADFHFLPFELSPDMDVQGEEINDHLGQRYGWSDSKRRDYRKNLLVVAEQAGVAMDFSKRTHYYNTYQAHILIHWCEKFDQQQAMNELLIDAYFKQGLDINNSQVLLNLVEQLGLDRSQAEVALNSAETRQQVTIKKQRVQQAEITSVPAFIFNDRTLVTGSNSVEYFEQALTSKL
ncbi:MAG: putative DsbA family dithiol-disulfide isomerase [Oleispira sp.]|jgi:predicted DsbA family dithiol-disulfide isomerase